MSDYLDVETRCGHVNGLTDLAFSADSKHLLSTGRDGYVKRWSVESQQLLGSVLVPRDGYCSAVSLEPEGFLCQHHSRRNHAVSLVTDSGVRQIFTSEGDCFRYVSGRTAVYCNGSQYEFVDVVTGDAVGLVYVNQEKLVRRPRNVCPLVSLSANAVVLSGSNSKHLQAYDLSSGRLLWSYEVEDLFSCHWSDDGSWLVLTHGYSAPVVLDARTGEIAVALACDDWLGRASFTGFVFAFSPDGEKLAMGTRFGTVCLWDIRTGRLIREFVSPGIFANAVPPAAGQIGAAHDLWVMALAFSPDGRTLASGGYNHLIRLWDIETSESVGVLGTRANAVVGLESTGEDQSVLAAYEDGSVRRIGIDTGTIVAETTAVPGLTFGWRRRSDVQVALHAEVVLVSSFDGTVHVYDSASLRRRASFEVADCESINAVAVIPGGRRFVSLESVGHALPPRLVLRSSVDGTICKKFDAWPSYDGLRLWGSSLAVSKDGSVVAVGLEGTLSFWNTISGELMSHHHLMDHHGNPDQIASLQFIRDNIVAVGMEGVSVLLIDSKTGKTKVDIDPRRDSVTAVAFSPDGQRLAIGVGYDNITRVVDVETNEVVQQFFGHQNSASQVLFTPCGQWLITGGYDGLLKIWNTRTGDLDTTIAQPEMLLL